MAFVMGGSILKINEAEKSGAWGGFMVGVIFFVTTLILFANSDKIASSDVPMLAIAKEVNPIFATFYALVIFGLIFNTVFSLYYALGKRFSAGSDKRFKFFVAAFALAAVLAYPGCGAGIGPGWGVPSPDKAALVPAADPVHPGCSLHTSLGW